MKRTRIVVAAFLIILVLAALAYMFLGPGSRKSSYYEPLPPPTDALGAESEAVAEFVASFYQWYLLNQSGNPLFSQLSGEHEELEPWLTDDFRQNLDQYALDFEGNPLLMTNGDTSSWGTDISTETVSEYAGEALVYVAISSPSGLQELRVTVVKDPTRDGKWRISAVSN